MAQSEPQLTGLSPRQRGEVTALVDQAVGDLVGRAETGTDPSLEERVLRLEAERRNLEAETRLRGLAVSAAAHERALEAHRRQMIEHQQALEELSRRLGADFSLPPVPDLEA